MSSPTPSHGGALFLSAGVNNAHPVNVNASRRIRVGAVVDTRRRRFPAPYSNGAASPAILRDLGVSADVFATVIIVR